MVDIEFVDPGAAASTCAAAGVRKLAYYAQGVLNGHAWVACERPPGSDRIEFGAPEPTEPSAALLKRRIDEAHAAGLRVDAYSILGLAGVWAGSRHQVPRVIEPVGRVPRFAVEHPEFMSKARDGRSWLDWDVGEPVLGYDVGYLALAHPEVRAYARRELVAFARDFGADGVQLEFLPVLAAGESVWPLGYDDPALAEYRRRFGVDPRSRPADDPAWARLRAEYVTQFFRELRRDLEALGRPVEVAAATEGIWARPDEAYKLGLDWPAWVEEGLVDAINPRFFLNDPLYPPSDPSSEAGSWLADIDRIEREVATVRGVVGNRCRVCATAIASNAPANEPVSVLVERIVAAARAMVASGSDGFGIYTDARVTGDDAFWSGLRRIHQGRF
ncbi:MAG: family 10 glycosylhydrolase [Chloroflexi bacterium]|nr:family 10 glycosylhydrolase [Chloroflexota bacterium]